MSAITNILVFFVGKPLAMALLAWVMGVRYVSSSRVGLVQRKRSVPDRRVPIPLGRGYTAATLRGGFHYWLFPWRYRVRRVPLVSVAKGRVAYIFALHGEPRPSGVMLARSVECNGFADGCAFLTNGGERGLQRELLGEGDHAVNTALFAVLAEDRLHHAPDLPEAEVRSLDKIRQSLIEKNGFDRESPWISEIEDRSRAKRGKIPVLSTRRGRGRDRSPARV